MNRVAFRYARALFSLAQEHQAMDSVLDHLQQINTHVIHHEGLSGFFNNPLVTRAESQRLVKRLSETYSFHPLVEKFLLLLSYNRRLKLFSDIVKNMLLLQEKQQKKITGVVISAKALSSQQTRDLCKVLSDKFNQTVLLDSKIDETLLGGLVIQLGSYRLDSSLKSKLQSFQTLVRG